MGDSRRGSLMFGQLAAGVLALLLAASACGDDTTSGGTGGSAPGGNGGAGGLPGAGNAGKGGMTSGSSGTASAEAGANAGGVASGGGGDAGDGPGGGGEHQGGAGGAGPTCDTGPGKALEFQSKVVDMVAGDLGADFPGGDTPRTLELWAKFTSAESWTAEQAMIELGKGGGGPNRMWGIDMDGRSANGGRFGPYTGGASDNNGGGTRLDNTPADVGWLHLAWAYQGSGGALVFTVNGDVLPTQVPVGSFSLNTTPAFVLLGASQVYGNEGWDGVMDEVRVWTIYRTPGEIKASMRTVFVGTEPGLAAYYRFSEGSGTYTDDEAGELSHRLSFCTAAGGACPAANLAAPTWLDSDIPGPFTCAP